MANTSYIGTGPADRDPTVSDDSVTEGKIANDAVTTTKIADNAVDGAKIALTSNAQGDIMYYSGTDWVLLTAASAASGQAILSGGAGQNPSWGSAGDFKDGGDVAVATRTIGNTNNYDMGFETNDKNWFNLTTDGFPQIINGIGMNSDTACVGTTLSAGIDAVVTTIPLTSVAAFPKAGNVKCESELISYTGITGNNLTGATRGAGSSTAAVHANATAIGTQVTTPSNYNGLSAGPIGVAVGGCVVIGTDSTWTIA